MTACMCGCGREVLPAQKTDARRGYKKGQPQKYAHGGRPLVEFPSYNTVHAYLNMHYPKTGICSQCGAASATDYALIHGHEYTRDIEDYHELCRRCHMHYDGLPGLSWRMGAVTHDKNGRFIAACAS